MELNFGQKRLLLPGKHAMKRDKRGFPSKMSCQFEKSKSDTVPPWLTVPVLLALWIFSYISHCSCPLIGRPTPC